MGASLAGAGQRGGRRGRRTPRRPMAEINVTPLVDVMLVLLIVFMVAAPLLTVGVPIDLPETQAQSLNTDSQPITVSVTLEGTVFVGDESVPLEGLLNAVEAAGGTVEDRLYVRGDANAGYGTVMRVMGLLSGAGYSRIGLITEQEQVQ